MLFLWLASRFWDPLVLLSNETGEPVPYTTGSDRSCDCSRRPFRWWPNTWGIPWYSPRSSLTSRCRRHTSSAICANAASINAWKTPRVNLGLPTHTNC